MVIDEQDLNRLLNCFGTSERKLLLDITQILPQLSDKLRVETESAFHQAVETIPPVVRAMRASPICHESQTLGGRERTPESLVDSLCRETRILVEFCIPTGAHLGRAMVLARINFLKALEYCFENVVLNGNLPILDGLREAIDDAIFSKMAEELLTGVVTNPLNSPEIRRAAAHKLLHQWEDFLRHPVGDFPSVLLSAWKARRRVRAIYGTLFGSDEILSLIREECAPRFVSFFTRDQVTTGEAEAFREFLFALPYEELLQIQEYMREKSRSVVSREEVYQLVKKTLPEGSSDRPRAEEVFQSYRRRRLRAEYRALSQSPGPHKTAEGYIMEALLREEIQSSAGSP